MTKYRNVIFMQGDEALPFIETLNEYGSKRAMEELFEYDIDENGEFSSEPPFGNTDELFVWKDSNTKGHYILSVNWDIPYIALTEVIED